MGGDGTMSGNEHGKHGRDKWQAACANLNANRPTKPLHAHLHRASSPQEVDEIEAGRGCPRKADHARQRVQQGRRILVVLVPAAGWQ